MDWSRVAFTLACKAGEHYDECRRRTEEGRAELGFMEMTIAEVLKSLSDAINSGVVRHDEVNDERSAHR